MAMLWFVLALAWEGTNLVVCLHGGPLGSICCLAVGCARSLTSKEAYRRKRHTHTHACTQAIHMQDSCTLALLCSGPPVGVGRASLRRFWKGKRPLGAATQCRESMATEPEVATRAQAARGPPIQGPASAAASVLAIRHSNSPVTQPASQPAGQVAWSQVVRADRWSGGHST